MTTHITDDRDLATASADAINALARLARLAELAPDATGKAEALDHIASRILPAVTSLIVNAGEGIGDYEEADADAAGDRLDAAIRSVEDAAGDVTVARDLFRGIA